MITRRHLRLDTAIRYSWKNIFFSLICSIAAYVVHIVIGWDAITIPLGVVGVLGTALSIILGFRNSSAYDRWWEARKIWGGVVNESRTFTRQGLTIVDPKNVPEELWRKCTRIVHYQIAWVNALRLQLREQKDEALWQKEVGYYLRKKDFEQIMQKTNKVTQIAMLNGYAIKELNAHDIMDIYSYIQMDDTLTRLTDLQGRAERIKATPLPRPYDYYTLAFLSTFILFLPFSLIETFISISAPLLVVPVTIIVGWIFYQIYVLGLSMSSPFQNWKTDVPLSAISTVIEIDLKEIIGDADVPSPLKEDGGALM
ncbi:putative membrane protein [Owenweeksia hongkongensis DSM 17368]|uniref:Putative membrane protein n=1 Tax=Owenweeksia hongkongensis (strain DSM 17368 / CIP 108786 / JCM 12287 / NRRL B-23963 / UST20020801) TaxID=926562 RepID=G8R0Z4_OWEHD|nr:bestrophin family ion channel [Owenweeksia hongkongensis]AEV31665.1 putative membrane protein [Owenweeksia hongkongensis DSM 17368]